MYEPMTIRLNDGQIVTRPYREAVSLLSRRLAHHVPAEEVPVPLDEEDFVPLEEEISGHPDLFETRREWWESLNKPDLVEQAKSNGLPTYGTKEDLIERLEAAYAAEENDRLSATTVEDDLDDLVGASPEDVPGEDSDDDSDGRD